MIAARLGRYLRTCEDVVNRLSDRIYPVNKPQGVALPNCSIATFSGTPDYTLTGEIADLAKMVQVDVDGSTYVEAVEIADLIRQELSFFAGTWDDTVIKSCTVANERDQSFPPADGSDKWTYRRSIDYRVTYVR